MEDLTIYTLTMLVRGFSNEVTVSGLASQMGISYSTLARCKNGVWPRSVTREAMWSVFDDCRQRFFAGDGASMTAAIMRQLHAWDLYHPDVEVAFAAGDYEAFLSTLLGCAAHPSGACRRASEVQAGMGKSYVPAAGKGPMAQETLSLAGVPPAVMPTEASPEETSLAAAAAEKASPERPASASVPVVPAEMLNAGLAHALMRGLPVALVLLVGLLRFSVVGAFSWASAHQTAFVAISVGIALLPAVVGVAVDSPLAWRAYLRTHPDAPFSWRAFARVAKYGDLEEVVPGTGRFNLTLPYLAFQPGCNLLGMLCYLALFCVLLRLPGFSSFFVGHRWVENLKVAVALSCYLAYGSVLDECRRPLTGDPASEVCENPDTYLPTRWHVWANALHLVWTLSLLVVGLLALLAYSAAHLRAMPAPAAFGWPYLQAVAYFAFSCASPYAVRTRATGVGQLVPGVAATSLGFVLLVLLCYLPSLGGVSLCLACATCTAAALVWEHRARAGGLGEWLAQGRNASIYALAVAATIFALLALGLATLTFA